MSSNAPVMNWEASPARNSVAARAEQRMNQLMNNADLEPFQRQRWSRTGDSGLIHQSRPGPDRAAEFARL
jgi:hypothetical protein